VYRGLANFNKIPEAFIVGWLIFINCVYRGLANFNKLPEASIVSWPVLNYSIKL